MCVYVHAIAMVHCNVKGGIFQKFNDMQKKLMNIITSMANCLVKLQAFNLPKDFPALRASTDSGPWCWVPDLLTT